MEEELVLIILKTKLQVRTWLGGLELSPKLAKFKLIPNKERSEGRSVFQHELKTRALEIE